MAQSLLPYCNGKIRSNRRHPIRGASRSRWREGHGSDAHHLPRDGALGHPKGLANVGRKPHQVAAIEARQRKWFPKDVAATLVDEGGLALIIDEWR